MSATSARLLCVGMIVGLVLTGTGCRQDGPHQVPTQTIVRIGRVTDFHPERRRGVQDALASAYRTALPGVDVQEVWFDDAVASLTAVHQGQAEIALALPDLAYSLYVGKVGRQTEPYARLRGIAALGIAQVHLFVRADSDIRAVEDLGGELLVGIQQTTSPLTANLVLSAFGASTVKTEVLDFRDVRKVVARMENGTLDAVFFNSSPPEPVIAEIVKAGARLIPITGPAVDRLLAGNPFFELTTLRGGIYPNHPTNVHTVGMRVILVCRNDLPPALVYALTKELFASGALRLQPTPVDLASAPATPIPLHEGAATYYRERELLP